MKTVNGPEYSRIFTDHTYRKTIALLLQMLSLSISIDFYWVWLCDFPTEFCEISQQQRYPNACIPTTVAVASPRERRVNP
jgi:hypothetical protein